jgi:hypothetical protein
MLDRFDKYWIGILVGLLMPAAFGYIYIDHFNLWSSFRMFGTALSQTWSRLLFVSVFPDLAFVFVAYAADAWKISKGLVIGAMPYIIASIYFTF